MGFIKKLKVYFMLARYIKHDDYGLRTYIYRRIQIDEIDTESKLLFGTKETK